MAVQLNVNVSGMIAGAPLPTLINDNPNVGNKILNMDPGSMTRGNFRWDSPPAPGGWTLIWGAKSELSRRVWLSLNFVDTGDHPALPDGWTNEAAVLGDGKDIGFPPVLAYTPLLTELPMIGISGLDFVVDGRRWLLNGQDHFLALEDILEGREPLTYDGGNAYRVFLSLLYIPGQVGRAPLDPDRWSPQQFWDATHQLVSWAAKQGKYVLWSIGDVKDSGKSEAWLSTFLAQFGEAHQQTSGLFGGLNEPWNPVNGWGWLPRPNVQMPCSSGSIQDASGSDGYDGDGMRGDYLAVHPRRDAAPDYKMLTHANLAGPRRTYNKVLVVDEGFKAGTVIIDGKQYSDPDFFRSQGAAYRAANGGIYHSFHGCSSQPLDGVEEACRLMFFQEW